MALPEDFVRCIQEFFPQGEAESFLEAIEQKDACVSVRLNTGKVEERGILAKHLPESIPWCADGYYLSERVPFTFDPLFHAGAYYVQEASSMFLAAGASLFSGEPITALDLCAAPGGKSTLLRSLLPMGSLLVSNEVISTRAAVLQENMQKWGDPNVVVSNGRPEDFGRLTDAFDLLLTDVPCSGEGMFRKDPNAIREWSLDNVAMSAHRQREILAAVWPALKVGGTLIYSTCTYNTAENEENIQWICRELGAEVVSVEVPDAWRITGSLHENAPDLPVYRFLPHKTKGEGLFMAFLRKTETSASTGDFVQSIPSDTRIAPKKGREQRQAASTRETTDWLNRHTKWLQYLQQADDYQLFTLRGDDLYALHKRHISMVNALRTAGIKLLSAGIPLATQRGHDLIPNTALALSTALHREAFPRVELNYKEAITFLQRNNLILPPNTPKGFVIVTFRDFPLGFVKNIGTRANNLYPTEWRIRSTHMPDQIPELI